jgi:hypothetical protein
MAMKSAYSGRKKRWGLKAAIKPQQRFDLSGVCRLLDQTGAGYCHIKFSWPLVVDMGRAMPRGVGPHEPAHLMAMRMNEHEWNIFCCYLDGERQLVWTEEGRPSWIKSIKRKENDE